jgi:CDP-diacylglycerol--serine O-phosphatidyltransferase
MTDTEEQQPPRLTHSRRRQGGALRVLRATAVLPAFCTLLNALAGFAAIHFAAKDGLGANLTGTDLLGNLRIAAALIFVAMAFDMLDGRLARMTRTTSDFGAQLDSLCDTVSFGVAPAMLILRSSISILRARAWFFPAETVERIVWLIAAMYVLCVTLRLARFNVETDQDESAHMNFRGLPSPGAAAMLAAIVLLFADLMSVQGKYPWLHEQTLLLVMALSLPVLTLLSSLLMVTRFRYPHLVNQYIRGRKPFSYLVKIVVLLLAGFLWPFPTLAAVTVIYVFSGPTSAAFKILRRR